MIEKILGIEVWLAALLSIDGRVSTLVMVTSTFFWQIFHVANSLSLIIAQNIDNWFSNREEEKMFRAI